MDVEDIISIATSTLTILLFFISSTAYRRRRSRKLLLVTMAFFLFSVKGILMSFSDIFSPEGLLIEPLAHLLDFGVLALFFLGLVRE
jgi:hypothetical protein